MQPLRLIVRFCIPFRARQPNETIYLARRANEHTKPKQKSPFIPPASFGSNTATALPGENLESQFLQQCTSRRRA